MIYDLPYEVQLKYAHIFEEREGMHRIATANNQYFLQGFPGYIISGLWDRFGFIDSKGNEVISPQYFSANDFNNGLALVETTDNKKSFIDKSGKTVINLDKYSNAYSFSCGLACVQVDKKFGFINTKGELVIQPKFDYVIGRFDFLFNSAGNVGVAIDDKYGIINTEGEYLFKPEYDLTRYNYENDSPYFMALLKNGVQYLLDENANIIDER